MVYLPVSSRKERFTVQLADVLLDFYFYFNDRSQLWMFDMADNITGTVMLAGCPVVLGEDFFWPYIFGIGALGAVDMTQQHTEAGPDDLGTRVVIPFLTPAEVITYASA